MVSVYKVINKFPYLQYSRFERVLYICLKNLRNYDKMLNFALEFKNIITL